MEIETFEVDGLRRMDGGKTSNPAAPGLTGRRFKGRRSTDRHRIAAILLSAAKAPQGWSLLLALLLIASGSAGVLAQDVTPSPNANSIGQLVQDDDLPDSLSRLAKSRGKRTQAEIDEIRYRSVGRFERESEETLAELSPVARLARESTFEVISDKFWVGMGAIISSDGYALTKASELEKDAEIRCRFSDKRSIPATVVKIDSANDIALLKLQSGTYRPLVFSGEDPIAGTVVLTVGVRSDVMAMGVVSCESRNLIERGRALLGVVPSENERGILISDVRQAAEKAGLRDGDVIMEVSGQKVKVVTEFVNMIRRYRAGDEVVVRALRDNQELELKVILGGTRIAGRSAPRFEAMNLLGSINSKRNDSFPLALQHDTPLMPEQCGGPLLNLDGKAIGINLARGGRIKSYAITGPGLAAVIRDFQIPAAPIQPTTTERQ